MSKAALHVTYLEQLVRGFLVLLGHGVRRRLGGHSDAGEEGETGGEADGNAPGDASVGSGRVDGAGAVRAEGDPVGYRDETMVSS